MHRPGHGDHPSQQIDVGTLRARLRNERLAAAGITPRRRPEPTRVTMDRRGRRHLVGVALALVFVLGVLGVAVAATAWHENNSPRGYVRACISCHGLEIGRLNVDQR